MEMKVQVKVKVKVKLGVKVKKEVVCMVHLASVAVVTNLQMDYEKEQLVKGVESWRKRGQRMKKKVSAPKKEVVEGMKVEMERTSWAWW